jgi:hypothetical protein
MFSSTPTTETHRATYRNNNGMIMEEMVTVPNGQVWQVQQIIEGRYGNGSFIGSTVISSQ